MINIYNLSLSTALAFGPLSNILVTTPYCDRFFLFSHSTDSFGLKLSRWYRQLLKATWSRKYGSSWGYSMCIKGTREGIQGTRAYHYRIKSHHKDGYLPNPRKGWRCGWSWTQGWWLWRCWSGSGLIETYCFTSLITNWRFQPRNCHRAHGPKTYWAAAQQWWQVLMLKMQWHQVVI